METRPIQEALEEFKSLSEVVKAMEDVQLSRHTWKGRTVIAQYRNGTLTEVTTRATIRVREGGEKGAV